MVGEKKNKSSLYMEKALMKKKNQNLNCEETKQ